MNPLREGAPPARAGGGACGRQDSTARLHLLMTIALVAAIAVAATAVSMGAARAQSVQAITRPDTGLIVALLAAAIGVMGILSAFAVRIAGRPRQR